MVRTDDEFVEAVEILSLDVAVETNEPGEPLRLIGGDHAARAAHDHRSVLRIADDGRAVRRDHVCRRLHVFRIAVRLIEVLS
jgi:hypothetical protein